MVEAHHIISSLYSGDEQSLEDFHELYSSQSEMGNFFNQSKVTNDNFSTAYTQNSQFCLNSVHRTTTWTRLQVHYFPHKCSGKIVIKH